MTARHEDWADCSNNCFQVGVLVLCFPRAYVSTSIRACVEIGLRAFFSGFSFSSTVGVDI